MPASAGRVRMPHNNRMTTSASLKTTDIWSKTIGHDPYANQTETTKTPDQIAAEQEQARKVMEHARSQNLTDGANRDDFARKMFLGLKGGKRRRADLQAAAAPEKTVEDWMPSDDEDEEEFIHVAAEEDAKPKAKKKKKKHDKKRKSKKKKRKRDRDNSSSSSDSDSSDSEEEERRHRKRKRKRKHKSKKRRRDDSSSDSDSETDSYDSSDRSRERRKRKKHRRKPAKNSERSTKKASKVEDPPVFGQYGILKASDMFRKQRSFEVWMAEVKGMPDFKGPKWELKNYFDEYREDYNTATMPHKKYYDIDAWEMEEYKKQQKRQIEMANSGATHKADEAKHIMEQQRLAMQKQRADQNLALSMMNKDKIMEMKRQKQLKAELEIAFKTGDQEAIKRIKAKLEPE